MTARVVLGAAALTLTACAEEPRSAEYFERHHEEALEVSTLCATGAKGGDECTNAQAGLAAARREERMAAYRRQF
jgi:hypothetical protein